jgi:hypothetical protein
MDLLLGCFQKKQQKPIRLRSPKLRLRFSDIALIRHRDTSVFVILQVVSYAGQVRLRQKRINRSLLNAGPYFGASFSFDMISIGLLAVQRIGP